MNIPVYDELKATLRTSGLPIRYVAYRAGVRRETIARWLNGDVFFPRIDTLLKVAAVLGQHIELTPTVKKMVAYYPRREIKPPPVVKIGLSRGDLRRTLLKLQ